MSLPNDIQIIRTPSGEEMVVLPRSEFDRLVSLASGQSADDDAADLRDHDRAMAEFRAGRDEGLTADEMRALLAAPTPLAFWRKRRGLTQQELAEKAGMPQAYVSQLEAGKRQGSTAKLRALAQALDVRINDLMA